MVGVRAHQGIGAPEYQIGVGMGLGRILQNTGRWFVEIVDEDPIWRHNPPGSQFCEEIDDIIVLLGDMMQFDPSKLVLELAHLLAICCHERALVGGLLHDLVDDQL